MEQRIAISIQGQDLLRDPLLNKGTAFTLTERKEFKLVGLLPPHTSTMEEQLQRRYLNFLAKPSRMERYAFLADLQNRNETLFYRLVLEHIDEMLPYVYTPTVGDASVEFSLVYNASRGVYISYEYKDQIEEILRNTAKKDVDVMVVTDGERILGLGDVGIGGMVIPIGKLALYTIFAGVAPDRVLAVFLDVGTNNEKLLHDPLYIGSKRKRITGPEYYSFIDAFVEASKKVFPRALIQWEDFAKDNASAVLHRYQKKACSFNDDIQGTAAVTLSGLIAAAQLKQISLVDEHIAILGGGSAGMGIANILSDYLVSLGLTEEQARAKIYIVDRLGLVQEESVKLRDEQRPFMRTSREIQEWKVKGSHVFLADLVENVPITILIGVSAHKGAFDKSIVKQMLKYTDRPIIFPLSNPNSKAEALPEDLIKWTDGGAIVATGSPFAPVEYKKKSYLIPQCNNVYIYPSFGIAVKALGITEVTSQMFLTAAAALAKASHPNIFPTFHELREISKKIAVEIAQVALDAGLVSRIPTKPLEELIEECIWFPSYPVYERSNKQTAR